MKKIIFLPTLFSLAISCQQDQKTIVEKQIAEFDSLTKQTIEVHDEVMGEMGTIMDLSVSLDQRLKSLKLSTAKRTNFEASITDLNRAHNDMMDWMKDYSTQFPYEAETPSTQEELEIKFPILEKSFKNIKQVKHHTNKAITEARQLLKETE